MEARLLPNSLILFAVCSMGASYRTTNFVVNAPTATLATEFGQAAERYRRELAIEWLGHELPQWPQPCPITTQVGRHLGAGGATSFMFDHGRPFGWQMSVQGPRQRILDSVLPHEVTHTIFATHFGRPLPRWADEGACTTVEHVSEKTKQHNLLIRFLTWQDPRGFSRSRGIPFNRMFVMKEYPRDILPLYAQGYSLARFLIEKGGKQKFVAYVGDGMQTKNWTNTTHRHYGFRSLGKLQTTWLEWVRRGSPSPSNPQADDSVIQLAAARVRPKQRSTPIYRAQNSQDAQSDARTGASKMTQNHNSSPKQEPTHRSTAKSWYVQQSEKASRQSNASRNVFHPIQIENLPVVPDLLPPLTRDTTPTIQPRAPRQPVHHFDAPLQRPKTVWR